MAEELECDWSKVTTEYPTPGQNLARGRVWGNYSTGGSRGVRESHEYVRKGGAAARMMVRYTADDQAGLRAILRACIDMCRICEAECANHDHDHCRRCADMCRECAEDCHAALATLG